MIRISAVSYLNTAPFVYGIEHSGLLQADEYNLQREIPSVCAERLINHAADIGIVPVAVLPRLSGYKMLGQTCIGAIDKIDSVMLFSRVPLAQISHIILDWHSRTSVNLCRILASEFWKIQPEWVEGSGDFLNRIEGSTAALVIGDRALVQAGNFEFSYDLAAEWNRFTGLPFVFACWVAAPEVPASFNERFEAALQYGIEHLEEVIAAQVKHFSPSIDVKKYLGETVSYRFDQAKKTALETFLSFSGKLLHATPA
jgi:chorismate dehydratase